MVLEQFPQQFQRSSLVSPLLNEDIEYLSFLVVGSPHPRFLSANLHNHLIQMPNAIGLSTALANVGRDRWSKLINPATDGLVSDINPALRRQSLDIAQTQREFEIQPHGLTDDIRMKAVALE